MSKLLTNLENLLSKLKKYTLNKRTFYYLKRNANKQHNSNKVKVGFIVQMPELWDKQCSIYLEMCRDERFEPWLVIVPHFNFQNNELSEYGEEKDFYVDQCIDENYILVYNNNSWQSLKRYKFDYLFYQRPYDAYLPKCIRSSQTIRFAKNCYIPYAVNVTGGKKVISPESFFRNLYFGFLENEADAEDNVKRFDNNCSKNLQYFLNIGYPCFEKCLSINKQCSYKRLLWTPRWSYEPVIGGSHFMEYYKQLCDFKCKDLKLTVRPHPLMWDNFIKSGIISESGMNSILELWKQKDIIIDSNKNIEDSFVDTDILISDRSSVIIMFFLTGKPIIYCPMDGEYDTLFSLILPGLYIAYTWEDLEKYIIMLSNCEDPLYITRQEIIKKNFSNHIEATKRIVNMIAADYFSD